jgi:uncharacterized membrane protein YfcA
MPFTFIIILILILIGLLSGALSGMVGVGGGIIIVPALVYFLAFSQKEAQGTSLGIMLLPVGILGVIQYYKEGQVDWRVVLIVSLAFLVGAFLGSKLALTLPDRILKRIFAILLLIVALKMLLIDNYKKDTPAIKTSGNVEKLKT